ncbi:MAG: YidC/Oxa1 family membrane protein insertase [Tissierellia bacterium]|nr:YidC/Oxa1 family membrane protein insertase [Bacillota bacterium]NLK59024.1 YidC/Oxa1 family membrane protein insertase [Tissierellia bacterium]
MSLLRNILGSLIRVVFQFVSSVLPQEPASISYLAISIIITTIIFKLAMLPITLKQIRSQREMQKMQPLMQELQRKYKNNPEIMNKKLQELYKEHNYNPAGGCLPLLIQFPIIIAFFGVMREPGLYIFDNPAMAADIAKNFFWIPNIEFPDQILWGLPLINAASQYLVARLSMQNTQQGEQAQAQAQTQTMMLYAMPIMMFFFARTISAGVIIYWITSNIIELLLRTVFKRVYEVREEGTE